MQKSIRLRTNGVAGKMGFKGPEPWEHRSEEAEVRVKIEQQLKKKIRKQLIMEMLERLRKIRKK